MKQTLKPIFEKIELLASTTKRKEKEAYIEKFLKEDDAELFVKVAEYAYNDCQYHMKEIPSQTFDNYNFDVIKEIFSSLDVLSYQTGATNEDRSHLGKVASVDEETFTLVNRIINKDLRCGVTATILKKYIPSLEQHKIMLCKSDLGSFINKAKSFDNICWSLKKDGTRVWAEVKDDKSDTVNYLSRNGKVYNNFHKFDSDLIKYAKIINKNENIKYPIKFDGEMISCKGAKEFDNLMGQVRRKENVDDSDFIFAIFDLVIDKVVFSERYKILVDNIKDNDNIQILKHYFYDLKSEEDCMMLLNKVTNDGEEGLVLKMCDSYYEYKKSDKWCKLKKFDTLDLKVIGISPGEGKNIGKVGGLIVDFNGNEVTVGSGISEEDREYFMTNIPKVIEVKYFEITKDGSLRFPVFVRVREDKE